MEGSEKVYQGLRQAIIEGTYLPNQIIAEGPVAEKYGTSRTPVREALRRLEQDAIVQRVGRQLRVRVTSPQEVLEIYDCRIVLEGMAAEWAANMRTDYDLAALTRAIHQSESLTTLTRIKMARAHHQFHVQVWRASHNSILFELLERLEVQIRRYPVPTVSQPGRWESAMAEHRAMLDAIRDRNAGLAKKLGAAHMAAARDLRLHMIQHGQDGLVENGLMRDSSLL